MTSRIARNRGGRPGFSEAEARGWRSENAALLLARDPAVLTPDNLNTV